ncbi:hypothetical protein BJX68DRAFT_277139 [Aspergillus pseudodeflectus]|uniref:FAD/NAD(P)-binding domain-containing protein n=1 Tax=Aspergillus pseudodeflectus TaxID=176178 RepID=A0ABR4K1V4_9EURO
MADKSEIESLDLVVIGAGWSGLAALKTYRQIHPSASTCLVESASSVGGVWARDRLWDGLKANNMRGTYEYSDFPMDDSFGVKEGEHIPGHVVLAYLERYVEHFGLGGAIRLGARVGVVEHVEGIEFPWRITYTLSSFSEGESSTETKVLRTRKLILATGLTSQPYLPHIPGQEKFNAPVLHTSSMPQYHKSVVTNPSSRIAIYGATKSAWDAVYAAATAGASVDWIIRDNGHGPVWMSPAYVTPLKRWLEKLTATRLLQWFSPCIWNEPVADGGARVRGFLHGTWAGRKIVDAFWGVLRNDVETLNRFDAHPETKKLKPWISPFWVASGLSILNYPTDFFDLVTKTNKVRIHTDHITSLDADGTIHLANSPPLLNIDALIVASGWKPTPEIEFRPATLPSELGFPSAPDPLPASLVAAADEEILRRFPRLKTRPVVDRPAPYTPLAQDAQSEAQALHPYRLTRFIVPVGKLAQERSIAFVGVPMTINTSLIAQTQALWVTAFFSNRLSLDNTVTETCPGDVASLLAKTTASTSPSTSPCESTPTQAEANILWETALHTQFGVHRYPGGLGKRNPDFVFDAIPYVDVLLKDLGVSGVRKEGSGWKRFVEPCGVEDYRGVLGEWIANEGLQLGQERVY